MNFENHIDPYTLRIVLGAVIIWATFALWAVIYFMGPRQ